MNENIEKYGDFFQQQSKYVKNNLPHHYLDWENKPATYKIYKNSISKVILPSPKFDEEIKFWDVLIKRHSIRSFSNNSLSLMELSLLLFGMEGLTRKFPNFAYRTTPSAGGLYPIEIYSIVNNVSELEQGIYHYNIIEHSLELLILGDFRKEVTECCLNQKMCYNSSVNFIWTAIINRSKWKYLQRCYRYIYLDCGHIAQNFYLIAEALGLGACCIGALFDDELNNLLKVDGINETVIYVGVVGKK